MQGMETFFELILRIEILSTSFEIGLNWVPQKPIDDKSTLTLVMVWCCQNSLNTKMDKLLQPL